MATLAPGLLCQIKTIEIHCTKLVDLVLHSCSNVAEGVVNFGAVLSLQNWPSASPSKKRRRYV